MPSGTRPPGSASRRTRGRVQVAAPGAPGRAPGRRPGSPGARSRRTRPGSPGARPGRRAGRRSPPLQRRCAFHSRRQFGAHRFTTRCITLRPLACVPRTRVRDLATLARSPGAGLSSARSITRTSDLWRDPSIVTPRADLRTLARPLQTRGFANLASILDAPVDETASRA